jgi:hypothetical protein
MAGHLNKASGAVRPTLVAARKVIIAAAPQAAEIPYQSKPPTSRSAMWKLARYAANGSNVVGLGTFANHSTLFFYRGRELDDGSGMLQGSGRDMRFITLRSPADVELPAVKRLVRKAFKLGRQASSE